MADPVYVLGVGMTRFLKPRNTISYPELAFEAGTKALLDANLSYDDISAGIAAYCYGDSTCGQRVFYQFGMTGIPIYNVNNNCSTGGVALGLARTLLQAQAQAQGGGAGAGARAGEAVLVIGFETMAAGSLRSAFPDRENPLGPSVRMMATTTSRSESGAQEQREEEKAPASARMFAHAGREYMKRFGAREEDFAEIARINHAHSAANPYSQFRDVYSRSEILASPMLCPPLTKLQCCPTSDGAAAAVLVSHRFLASRPHLRPHAVEIAGSCVATDSPALYSRSAISLVGFETSQRAALSALREANICPRDVQVVELHDCFSANEMLTLDALGLSEPGKAHLLVQNGDITHGGKYLVNPSGGLISKGHPLGATGVAQCAELVWHLRGWATNRAARGKPTRYCLQHNLGLGGAAFVAVYRRADGEAAPVGLEEAAVVEEAGVGYNPAVEARGFTAAEVDRVRSKLARSEWALQGVDAKVLSRF